MSEERWRSVGYADDKVMTVQGAVNKTGLLLILCIIPAGFVWNMFFQAAQGGNWGAGAEKVYPIMIVGGIVGFILAIITCFSMKSAPFIAPLYAVFEGLFIGGISAIFEAQYNGIVVQAVFLTFGTMAALLIGYSIGAIKVTAQFRAGVIAATGAIFLVYIANFALGFFGMQIPYLHDGGPIGIIISLVIVTIAALNLVLDFDFIDRGAQARAPKYMEWFGAFALMITLVWLYLEILRLLAKLRGGRR
jgi:uncharacterized YccA/Bax inhibitor family protein